MKNQLNKYLSGNELINELTVLPEYKEGLTEVPDRLLALLDLYLIYIPSKTTIDIYNRLYMSLLNSLDKKSTMEEIKALNENYLVSKGLKRYGIIGGLESFKITGTAGLGKTSSVQRCIDIITGNKILINKNPYREVIPILFVECVADGSFKSLLFMILKEVDSKIGTTYFISNSKATITVDILLSVVSKVLILHVALLVIDEIERVANDNKKGDTLINYLTQLVNQSNIAICFVGNESANKYFETKEYMSRRTIGISIKKMEYDESFYRFCEVIFKYQYVLNKIEFSAEYSRLLYKLSNGIPSMVISLFVETQREAIISGKEELSVDLFEQVFKNNFSNMLPYISLDKKTITKKKEDVIIIDDIDSNNDNLFTSNLDKDISTLIMKLRDYIEVEII